MWENVFVLRKFMLEYLELKWTDISGEREGDRERNRAPMGLNAVGKCKWRVGEHILKYSGKSSGGLKFFKIKIWETKKNTISYFFKKKSTNHQVMSLCPLPVKHLMCIIYNLMSHLSISNANPTKQLKWIFIGPHSWTIQGCPASGQIWFRT